MHKLCSRCHFRSNSIKLNRIYEPIFSTIPCFVSSTGYIIANLYLWTDLHRRGSYLKKYKRLFKCQLTETHAGFESHARVYVHSDFYIYGLATLYEIENVGFFTAYNHTDRIRRFERRLLVGKLATLLTSRNK